MEESSRSKGEGLEGGIQELRRRLEEHSLTIEDVIANTDIDPLLIELLLSNNVTTFARDVDALFKFAGLKLNPITRKSFNTYRVRISDNKVRCVCSRLIKPKCSMKYDFASGEFYDFVVDEGVSEAKQDIFKTEMKMIIEKFVRQHFENQKPYRKR